MTSDESKIKKVEINVQNIPRCVDFSEINDIIGI